MPQIHVFNGNIGDGLSGFSYSVSGGNQGVQFTGTAFVDGVAIRYSYATAEFVRNIVLRKNSTNWKKLFLSPVESLQTRQ